MKPDLRTDSERSRASLQNARLLIWRKIMGLKKELSNLPPDSELHRYNIQSQIDTLETGFLVNVQDALRHLHLADQMQLNESIVK